MRKSFGPLRAVDGVDFGVRSGEVLGFLGPGHTGRLPLWLDFTALTGFCMALFLVSLRNIQRRRLA